MKLRTVAVAVVVLVVSGLAVAGGSAYWYWAQLYQYRSPGAVELAIPEGLSGREVLDILTNRGLLPSTLAGRVHLRFAADGRSIRFGRYRIDAASRPVDVLDRVLDGRVEMLSVTVVEGSDLPTVAAQMAAAGIGSESEWLHIGQRVDWIEDLVPGAPSLEGFLFPDTYQFAEGIGVEPAARHLVDRFRAVWTDELSRGPELWGSPLDVVILASLVEAETALALERGRVAGVYHNRLRRSMLLQCDPTVVFALKRRGEWTGRLLRVHWGVDDPYNTYRYPGLPPGPINCPGREAIRAAISPDEHRYLYFVASPDGGHAFSRTLAEHNQAVARWQRSRR
jgi:peptidoglycan lytic transglycosylase G